MLYKQANEIYEEVDNLNDIRTHERESCYRTVIKEVLLKEKYGLAEGDMKGLKWSGGYSGFEYGDALLKYADSKVTDFSNQEQTKEQIREALSDVKGKETQDIEAMYAKRKEVAKNYAVETVLENSESGLGAASRFLDDETKAKIGLYADKIEPNWKKGFEESLKKQTKESQPISR